jgi:hypothetical protein
MPILGKLKENAMDHHKTIPSDIMPEDYQPSRKADSGSHPIWKIILAGLALVLLYWVFRR